MKSINRTHKSATLKAVLACLTAGWLSWNAGNACHAQTSASTVSPDLQEIIKLSQARQEDDVIVNFIHNAGKSYRLSADDIIYLSSQGISQPVISALQATATAAPAPTSSAGQTPPPQPAPSEATPTPPPVSGDPGPGTAPGADAQAAPALEANYDSFHNQLAPYGNWIETPDGPVWQPNIAPGWRPYYDGGHWANTDAGWYWQSDYPWGDITFHYGRWGYTPGYGWTWTPGYDFAPAWVCWRHADDDGFCGWAPLPPGALFVDGGWRYHDAVVAVDFDFGLSAGFFTFVDYGHFWEHDFRHFIVPHDRLAFIYGRSVFANHYRLDHGRFMNEGLDRERMGRLTGREIRSENVSALRSREMQDHAAQRQNDRGTVKAGGKIDAGRKVGEAPGKQEEARSKTGGVNNSTHSTPAAAGGTAKTSTSGALAMPGANRSGTSGASGATGGSTAKTGTSGALSMPSATRTQTAGAGGATSSPGSSASTGGGSAKATAAAPAKAAATSSSQKKKSN